MDMMYEVLAKGRYSARQLCRTNISLMKLWDFLFRYHIQMRLGSTEVEPGFLRVRGVCVTLKYYYALHSHACEKFLVL